MLLIENDRASALEHANPEKFLGEAFVSHSEPILKGGFDRGEDTAGA
jgi:hypothetical protein